MTSYEQNILDVFYSQLEKIAEFTPLIQPTISDWDKASFEFRLKICIEMNALSVLKQDHIRETFNDTKDCVIEYLIIRLQNTQNNLLKGKYNQFLYLITRNNQYGNQSIDEYQQTLASFMDIDPNGYVNLNFQIILDNILSLTKSTQYKAEELKEQIHSCLKDPVIHYRIKTKIIESISNTNIFKNNELSYIPELCCNLSENEKEHRFIEINLLLGLELAKKLHLYEFQRTINELLGDNEYKNIEIYDGKIENMFIPHYNSNSYIKIIQYYKNANNVQKRNKAVLEYNKNKKDCKLLKINTVVNTENQTKLHEMLDKIFLSIVSSSTEQIIFQLILGTNLMFIPDELLERHAVENENRFIYQFFKPRWVDINNNERDKEVREHLKFQFYSLGLERTMSFALDIIMTSFTNKKLSYKKIAKMLSKDLFFGKELIIERNDHELSYTWFDTIDIGVKSFFEQCSLLQRNKQADWRISIDLLTIKFEGIFRDMVGLAGGAITKVDKNGNTTEMLLDDLLRDGSVGNVFTKDDLNLFQYTFTNKGYNIRNNVAHAFYKPQDYNINYAVLVLLCIFRLAKFNHVKYEK